ncbi:MAG: nucleoside hydrolase, partial [Ktedonobacteraceae bacterium]|nr:nucleoside hydrolase [Ktedonobacteraceae bacterium]
CLAYLLAKPECDLLGVTTVTGEAEKRAMMVSALCKIADKDIPIYPGSEQPLLIAAQQPHAPQAAALSRWDHATNFPKGQAIDFMRQAIRANPGEVVLLGIGPLTNIALLFAIDPEIPSLLKELVLMCGVFDPQNVKNPLRHGCEWNALNDPHATAMVYQAISGRNRSFGLDVTTQVTMNAARFREKCQVPLLRPVLDFAEVWFQQRDIVTFHDPLAAVGIFHKDVCTYTPGTVEVEYRDEKIGGRTYWTPHTPNARYEVALEVQPERFFAEYFKVF